MAKWKGTVVPNSGYVEKVYFNTNLSIEEVVDLLEKLTFTDSVYFAISSDTCLLSLQFVEGTFAIVDMRSSTFIFLSSDVGFGFVGWNSDFNGLIEINSNVSSSFVAEDTTFDVGNQNDLISSLVSSTPFTQSQQTTADKLQKLIDGKQYVVDKTNAKAETSLPINCTWKELGDTIERITGSGSSGIVVPSVSNLAVNEDGIASWDEPDFTELEGFDYTYIYIVKVNGKEIETTNTNIDLMKNLIEGTNVISVVVKVTVTTIRNGKEINETIEFSMPSYAIVTLDVTLPYKMIQMSVRSVGTNIYLFGGYDGSSYHYKIYKYNTTTETIEQLGAVLPSSKSNMGAAAVGTNIYLFGGRYNSTRYDIILKFDSETETITTLSAKLPKQMDTIYASAVGTNIYLFGGRYSTMLKFDTTTETLETLDYILPSGLSETSVAAVGTNVYLFGGRLDSVYTSNIYKFDATTETLTLLNKTLPKNMSTMAAETIGTNIYLFGGYATSRLKTILKFDSETETVTTLDTTLPTATNNMGAAAVGTNIYLFGGNTGSNVNTIYKFIE